MALHFPKGTSSTVLIAFKSLSNLFFPINLWGRYNASLEILASAAVKSTHVVSQDSDGLVFFTVFHLISKLRVVSSSYKHHEDMVRVAVTLTWHQFHKAANGTFPLSFFSYSTGHSVLCLGRAQQACCMISVWWTQGQLTKSLPTPDNLYNYCLWLLNSDTA